MEKIMKNEELMQVNSEIEELKVNTDDLFTDSLDSRETIFLDIPEPVEIKSQNDKYLVPIFTSNSISTFVGNGVIVNSYLITAAHVAKNKKEENFPILYYKYEDEFKIVNDKDVVFDGRNVEPEDGICNDLIVYKLDGIVGGFKCNDTSVEKGTKLHTSFYTYLDNGRVVFDRNVCVVDSLGTLSLDKATYWQNCYRVYNSRGFVAGNSGCAFFCNDVLYGILLGGSESRYGVYKYTVLDAGYIRHIIEEFGE